MGREKNEGERERFFFFCCSPTAVDAAVDDDDISENIKKLKLKFKNSPSELPCLDVPRRGLEFVANIDARVLFFRLVCVFGERRKT